MYKNHNILWIKKIITVSKKVRDIIKCLRIKKKFVICSHIQKTAQDLAKHIGKLKCSTFLKNCLLKNVHTFLKLKNGKFPKFFPNGFKKYHFRKYSPVQNILMNLKNDHTFQKTFGKKHVCEFRNCSQISKNIHQVKNMFTSFKKDSKI